MFPNRISSCYHFPEVEFAADRPALELAEGI